MDQLAIWHCVVLQPGKSACDLPSEPGQHHPPPALARDAHLMPERYAQKGTRHRGGASQFAEGTQVFGCKPAVLPSVSRQRHSSGRHGGIWRDQGDLVRVV